MGKRIIPQRRGRGSSRYRSPSFNFKGAVAYPKQSSIGMILDIIHDPGRTAPIMEVKFGNEIVHIPAPEKIKTQTKIEADTTIIALGNIVKLKDVPLGQQIFGIEKNPGSGPAFCLAAGASSSIVAKTEDKAMILFKSKKQKAFDLNCRAMIGIVAGAGRKEKPFLKAGKKYYAMKARNKLYPRTSGVAMNAVDHPFGSGRGRHMGKPKTVSRTAPPGRKVGLVGARRTGRRN